MTNLENVSREQQLEAARAYAKEWRSRPGNKQRQRDYRARWLSKQALKMQEEEKLN